VPVLVIDEAFKWAARGWLPKSKKTA